MRYHEKLSLGETQGTYIINGEVTADDIFRMASNLASMRLARGKTIDCSIRAKEAIKAKLLNKKSECFWIMFLDNQHKSIAYEEMFQGTINAASVYPREIIRKVIEHNAAAVILAHNHPSGCPEPSMADKTITTRIKSALQLIDVTVIDHIIVGGGEAYSFTEHGIL